ncbi:hypothetical protein CU044_4135 [Streptomyces sp. L-9-10]|uniref:hypothetical protein n=1 Tax=Streptomyces sp. L-9-10 TaxID=1478131 RepID=UPI00101BF856|nr:hypothetical protein [Streptomyces sp. L-9-10]RYJ25250.1 hypothetical protein CU044_4135 [Streptomyces sp. L-9-10]
MRTKTERAVNLVVLLALCTAAAGCDGDKDDREARAREVAEAWEGSKAADVWGAGYYPMGDVIQPPAGGFHGDADKRAHATGKFVLRGELPTTRRKDGQVRWESGGSLTLPLTDARTAYESVARGGGDEPRLTVTAVKPGEMTLPTSRGPATVPAWLFSLEGYDTPLKRAALAPSKLPVPPVKPVGDTPTDELAPLGRLVEVARDGRSVTVMANHGSCDDGPAVDVLETSDGVVLSAYAVGTKDGPCTADLRHEELTVRLDRPVGDRILLDAYTGRPVPYGQPNQPSASWS